MANKGKRMLFEDEYRYLDKVIETYPDPTDIGGSGGDVNIEAGTGITITTESDDTKVISLDTNPSTFEVTASTGTTLEVTNANPLYKDSKLQMTSAGSTRLEGATVDIEGTNVYLHSDYAPYYVNNTTHEYKQLATTDQIPTNYVTTDTNQTLTGQKTWGSGNLTTSINNYSLQTKDNNSSIIYSNQGMQFDMYNSTYNKVYLNMIDHSTSPVSTTGQYVFVDGKKGNVAIEDDITTALSDYYTKTQSDNKYVSKTNLTDYSINSIIVGNSDIDGDDVNLRAVYSQDVKSEISADPTSTIIRTMSGTDVSTIGISATEIDINTPMLKYGTYEVATKNDIPTVPTTATSTSTVTPSTIQLTFTYTDDTTETVTLMTGASVSTTTTLS